MDQESKFYSTGDASVLCRGALPWVFCYVSISHSRLIPCKYVKLCHCLFYSFLPSFPFSPTCLLCLRLCLHTHCSCRGLLWHLIIFKYANTLGRNRTSDGLSQRPLTDKTQRGSFFPIIYLLRRHLTIRRRIIRGTDGVVKWNEVQWR